MNDWSNGPRYKFTLSKTQPLSQEDISILTAPIADLATDRSPMPPTPLIFKTPPPQKIVEVETTDPRLMARNLRELADQLEQQQPIECVTVPVPQDEGE